MSPNKYFWGNAYMHGWMVECMTLTLMWCAGIAAAQLVQQTALHSTEQLRVGFYSNADDCTARLNPEDSTDAQV